MVEMEIIAQGAEARLYKRSYLGKPTLVKERFEKKYRHPDLDTLLTKNRIKAEARAILRAKAAGVRTPAIYLVDYHQRSIFMEYMEGTTVLKKFIDEHISEKENVNALTECIAYAIGKLVAKLHSNQVIHGDLTTSNILLKDAEELLTNYKNIDACDRLVAIDFGLAQVTGTAEDAAVDLYVLERSLTSAHSEIPELFPGIFKSYCKHFPGGKLCQEIINKYEDVRARGRKRSMVG